MGDVPIREQAADRSDARARGDESEFHRGPRICPPADAIHPRRKPAVRAARACSQTSPFLLQKKQQQLELSKVLIAIAIESS